jgi:hypothetical protein
MRKAEQCRAKAAEYAQLALQMRDCDLRKSYQELARHWRQARVWSSLLSSWPLKGEGREGLSTSLRSRLSPAIFPGDETQSALSCRPGCLSHARESHLGAAANTATKGSKSHVSIAGRYRVRARTPRRAKLLRSARLSISASLDKFDELHSSTLGLNILSGAPFLRLVNYILTWKPRHRGH